ncbi:MAG: trehalase family glycosidase [Lachnospiraceae bacterium]|nr:trehalase family glycosidase [Lachnospiraceae bacterium]
MDWEKEKEEYLRGWHTWNNDSILSYIYPLDGRGIRLCIKDYKNASFLENVLIGDENANVIPRAHAYDDSFTHVYVEWKDNRFEVLTATEDDELYILIKCDDERVKSSSLIIQGLSLYNLSAEVKKENSNGTLDKPHLVLKGSQGESAVYVTCDENGELYVPVNTPYLSVELKGEIGISTNSNKSIGKIKTIIEGKKTGYYNIANRYGDKKDLYLAMQIAQAWDTIYDPVLRSPITTVSRIWNKQWGGYVLFCWDTYFGALMQSVDNRVLAYSNVFAITDAVTKEGFVPNYVCQNGFKSFDRSQPPVGSSVVLEIYNRYKEKWFLERVFDKLFSWNSWFYERRTTINGLLTWGSDPYEKYYDHHLESDGVGDWQGASYESGLDNSPMYEDIPFDFERYQLELDDVGLSGLYIQDCRALKEIAEILGRNREEEILSKRLIEIEDKMESLWDEKTGLYLNRRTDTNQFEYRLSPFHFHSLFSKKVGKERINRIIKEHLLNEEEFWTKFPIPSIAKSDPSYINQTYWQGRVWAPMNFLTFCALKCAGESETVELLAEKSAQLILKEWKECGHVHENYDPETGEGCNSVRSDKFYHWGGLLAYMSLTMN